MKYETILTRPGDCPASVFQIHMLLLEKYVNNLGVNKKFKRNNRTEKKMISIEKLEIEEIPTLNKAFGLCITNNIK